MCGPMQIKAMVFDKTRILTIGRPIVVGTKLYNNIALRVFYEMISAAEVTTYHVYFLTLHI